MPIRHAQAEAGTIPSGHVGCEIGRCGRDCVNPSFDDECDRGGDRTVATRRQNVWMKSPERSLGSNQVLFGGMIWPASAISIS